MTPQPATPPPATPPAAIPPAKVRFNTDGAIYMAARRDPAGCRVGLFGVPYDGTTSFRPGARFGPAAIREVSEGLETYDPQLDLDLEDLAFADLGALEIPFGAPEPVVAAVNAATAHLLEWGLRPLMLGGEHSISSGAVAAAAAATPDLVLVQLDAHADLRESWLGGHHSHACAMRRCLEVLPSGDLLQVAIRSGTREEFAELRTRGRLVSIERMAESLLPFRGRPIYLTVDLDWFDPGVLPGTGTPEPGGFHWHDFAALLGGAAASPSGGSRCGGTGSPARSHRCECGVRRQGLPGSAVGARDESVAVAARGPLRPEAVVLLADQDQRQGGVVMKQVEEAQPTHPQDLHRTAGQGGAVVKPITPMMSW